MTDYIEVHLFNYQLMSTTNLYLTNERAIKIGNKLHVDFNVISVYTFKHAIMVEYEYMMWLDPDFVVCKSRTSRYHSNSFVVTNTSKMKLALRVLVNLVEFPDYYEALERLEDKLKRKWIETNNNSEENVPSRFFEFPDYKEALKHMKAKLRNKSAHEKRNIFIEKRNHN